MPSTEERELERALEQALGVGPARTLISRLVPEGDELARQRAVDARFDAMDMKIDRKIDALDVKFEGRLQSLFARTVMANLAFMIALVGLVLAAVQLG